MSTQHVDDTTRGRQNDGRHHSLQCGRVRRSSNSTTSLNSCPPESPQFSILQEDKALVNTVNSGLIVEIALLKGLVSIALD
jgi:hypothetical protein